MCRPHTRFVRGSNPSGEEGGKETRRQGGELSQTLTGPPPDPGGAGLRLGGGPVPLGLPWRRLVQVGGGPWLEGEMP